MSTYEALRGLKVKYLAADPDPGTAGDVWYNTSTFQLKGFVGLAAWSAGSPLGTARYNLYGCGTLTAGLAFGGRSPAKGETEEYNGSGWATSGDTNTPRSELGAGNYASHQTAAIIFGGTILLVTWQIYKSFKN